MFMQSSGGLTDARLFQGKDSILSGPAGGVVGAVRTSLAAGYDRVIGFDMGGTSTDVSHFNGQFERVFETLVAGVRMRAPMMSIHTVAAGGGSILHFDGARYRVGPGFRRRAARTGVLSRETGPLTVTDANVMLGKIQPEFFPRVFGPRGDEALDADIVRQQVLGAGRGDPREDRRRAARRKRSPKATCGSRSKTWRTPSRRSRWSAAMTSPPIPCAASAAPPASTPARSPTRSPFRGSSSTRYAGVLSAYGMGLADITAMRSEAVEARLEPAVDAAARRDGSQTACGRAERPKWRSQGVPREDDPGRRARAPALRRHRYRRAGRLRHARGDAERFEAGYRQQFSFLMPGRALVVEAAVRRGDARPASRINEAQAQPPAPRRRAADRANRAACTAAAPFTTRRCTAAKRCARATPSPGRRSSPKPTRRPSSSRSGRPRSRR